VLAFLGTFFYASPRAKHNLLKLIPSELESEVTDLSQAERERDIYFGEKQDRMGVFLYFFYIQRRDFFLLFPVSTPTRETAP